MLCPLCQRDCPAEMMTRHHLKTRRVDRFDVETVCSDCHKTIHAFFGNREIARDLDTIEALLENEAFAKALRFIRKQAPGSRTRVRTAKRRPRR